MTSGKTWLAILGGGILCISSPSSAHVTRAGHAPGPRVGPLQAAPSEYHQGPVDLRLGDPGALLIPAGCRVRCAGSSFAEVECRGALLEARSPAYLWPEPQHEERLPGGGVAQWAQYGEDFVGVLVAADTHFALLQRRSTDVGRSHVLQLLRSFHSVQAARPQVNCPAFIVLK
jgi:hypothetical protein